MLANRMTGRTHRVGVEKWMRAVERAGGSIGGSILAGGAKVDGRVCVCLGWLECDPAPIKANSGLCLSRAAETLGAVALWRQVVLGGQVKGVGHGRGERKGIAQVNRECNYVWVKVA